ncbi:hypothetical protein CYY_001029 [Polysphondylium violaceum]|uniref:Rab-GAP TBC domain-containing protein n=1 Tax=Polysphondylium violaceum TaxID=133409 RepID=A0A8J4V8B1_9MYCE|nr:hypothetical protein CYY_001029 [Polysphondylium violaceum]
MALAFPPHAIQAILETEHNLFNNKIFLSNINDDISVSPSMLRESKVAKPSINKYSKFKSLLSQNIIDIDSLRALSWGGIPMEHRPLAWKLLLNYLPIEKRNHNRVLMEKRNQYKQLVHKFYTDDLNPNDNKILNQVRLDVPRTIPRGFNKTNLIQSTILHNVLERILYVWSLSNPLISYFQGLNDIPAQFLLIFLSQYINLFGDLSDLTDDILERVEADTFWCFSLLMNNLKNRFIDFHDGIQRMTLKLEKLVKLKEEKLADHLKSEGCDFMLFSIRWMICLLCREFDFSLSARLWDSYIAHGPNFGYFHIYICAALITTKEWVPFLHEKEFSEIIVFLQHLPTEQWNICHIDYLLVRAYKIFLLEIKSLVSDSFKSISSVPIQKVEQQQQQLEDQNIISQLDLNNNSSSNNNNSGINNNYKHPFIRKQNNDKNNIRMDSSINSIILKSQMKDISSIYNIIQQNDQTVNSNNNNSNNSMENNIQLKKLQELHQNMIVSSFANNSQFLNQELLEKVLELIPGQKLDFSTLSPEDADQELIRQVTVYLMLIMGTLLLVSVVLVVIIISTALTITSLEFYNNHSNGVVGNNKLPIKATTTTTTTTTTTEVTNNTNTTSNTTTTTANNNTEDSTFQDTIEND